MYDQQVYNIARDFAHVTWDGIYTVRQGRDDNEYVQRYSETESGRAHLARRAWEQGAAEAKGEYIFRVILHAPDGPVHFVRVVNGVPEVYCHDSHGCK